MLTELLFWGKLIQYSHVIAKYIAVDYRERHKIV